MRLAVAFLLLVPFSAAGHDDIHDHAREQCPCASARQHNEWCDVCEVGYIGPLEVHDRLLHEVLDAHGHKVDPSTFSCPTCKAAIAGDGFCQEHEAGFLDGQAYFSLLSYELTRALRQPAAAADCACEANQAEVRWCEACGVGFVAGVVLHDRDTFERVARAVEILRLAEREAERCPQCGAALLTDTECPVHRTRFQDGKKQEPAPPAESTAEQP